MARVTDQEILTMKERLEELAGIRGDKRKAAIRMIYLTQLQELISKLTKTTIDLQNLVSDINTDVLEIRDDVTIIEGDISHLQADVGGLQGDVVQITGDIAVIQQGIADANQDLDNLQLEIGDLQTEVNGLAGVTAEVDQLQIDVGTLQTGQANLSNDVNGIKTDVNAVSIPTMSQGSVAEAPTAAQFNALVSDVAALRQALASIKTAII